MGRMSQPSTDSNYLEFLSEKLIDDIRRRGLSPGMRYLNTEEVSRMLGIRKAVANRALRHLADQEILVRRQRSGTLIGPRFEQPKNSAIQVLHVLLTKDHPLTTDWAMGLFTKGLLKGFSDVNVQFSFVPGNEPIDFVRNLVETSQKSGQFAGVVAVSCRTEVYRFLAEARVPAIAYGTLYPMPSPLPSVDVDNRRSAKLLTRYLVDRGHRRMALLSVAQRRAGDNDFFDGISETLASTRLPHTALIHRQLPQDLDLFDATLLELLRLPEPPSALIVRASIIADRAYQLTCKRGFRVPEDLEIVLQDEGQTTGSFVFSPFPRVLPSTPFEAIATMIGQRLKELGEGKHLPPEHYRIPVTFHMPKVRTRS